MRSCRTTRRRTRRRPSRRSTPPCGRCSASRRPRRGCGSRKPTRSNGWALVVARSPDRATRADRRSPSAPAAGDLRSQRWHGPETVANSLYAEGGNGTRILNTRFRSRAIHEDTREEVRKLEAQIKQLHKSAQQLQGDLRAAEENQKFLAKLEAFTGATMQHLSE